MKQILHTTLRRTLREWKDRPAFFFPNPGNAGDNLITTGTLQIFKDSDLYPRHLEINLDRPVTLPDEPATLFYGGGGNFVPNYSHARLFFERYHQTNHRLVLLPQTIRGNEDLLQQLGGNSHLFCRDQISYTHARRHASGANVYLDHDLALALRPDTTRWDFGLLSEPLSTIRLALSYLTKLTTGLSIIKVESHQIALQFLHEIHRTRRARPNGATLNAFRTDSEANSSQLPDGNLDLSEICNPHSDDPILSKLAAVSMLTYVNQYTEIHTDRLHVAISGLLLGKKIRLFANNYDKNQSVLEHSLASNGAIEWCGER